MDPYLQAALIAAVGALGAFLGFRFIVPLLPADPPKREPPPAAAE